MSRFGVFRASIILLAILIVLVILGVVGAIITKAATNGNLKYEVENERIIVSCVDGTNPTVRTVPRPTGGYYAVVVCEKGR